MTTYPVVDRIPFDLAKRIGVSDKGRVHGLSWHAVKAVATGEVRPPEAGEWFLSGAIVEAHFAPNNLTAPYRIARLVKVRIETIEIVEGIADHKKMP